MGLTGQYRRFFLGAKNKKDRLEAYEDHEHHKFLENGIIEEAVEAVVEKLKGKRLNLDKKHIKEGITEFKRWEDRIARAELEDKHEVGKVKESGRDTKFHEMMPKYGWDAEEGWNPEKDPRPNIGEEIADAMMEYMVNEIRSADESIIKKMEYILDKDPEELLGATTEGERNYKNQKTMNNNLIDPDTISDYETRYKNVRGMAKFLEKLFEDADDQHRPNLSENELNSLKELNELMDERIKFIKKFRRVKIDADTLENPLRFNPDKYESHQGYSGFCEFFEERMNQHPWFGQMVQQEFDSDFREETGLNVEELMAVGWKIQHTEPRKPKTANCVEYSTQMRNQLRNNFRDIKKKKRKIGR